jgi:hypothetical protein
VNRDLSASRRHLEESLEELRRAAQRDVGWLPRASRWALPLVAAAVGLVVGLAVRRNLPRLGPGD